MILTNVLCRNYQGSLFTEKNKPTREGGKVIMIVIIIITAIIVNWQLFLKDKLPMRQYHPLVSVGRKSLQFQDDFISSDRSSYSDGGLFKYIDPQQQPLSANIFSFSFFKLNAD